METLTFVLKVTFCLPCTFLSSLVTVQTTRLERHVQILQQQHMFGGSVGFLQKLETIR
jgi:hypothetical protein